MNRLGLRQFLVALTALLVSAAPLFAVGVDTGFLATNPQIFPVGDLVDINALVNSNDGGENFNWDSLPDIIYFSITPSTPDENEKLVILHVDLSFGGIDLIRWWSREFKLDDWVTSTVGSHGYYTNRQLGHLKDSGWMHEDNDMTYYADTGDFLSVLDGSRIAAGIGVVRIELFDYNSDTGDRGVLLASMTRTIQVYNPSAPSLQQPDDAVEISNLPISFSWNWSGGPLTTSDITLTIIEGSPGDDGETVMESRNPSKVRYSGPPQFTNGHTYTGIAGGEQAFENGKIYFWQVKVNAGTAVPGRFASLESNIYSFTFNSSSTSTGGGQGTGNELNPVLAQLQSILPPELIAQLNEELEGFTLAGISIDGVSGYQMQDLMQILTPQSASLMSVTIE
ncbi:MAG: hypothetical protein V2A56_02595 [bacterium]